MKTQPTNKLSAMLATQLSAMSRDNKKGKLAPHQNESGWASSRKATAFKS